MYKFKYDIKINEENGRPYIDLPEDYSAEPEHRFMALEITAYSLNDLVVKYSQPDREVSQEFLNELIITANFVSELSDQLASLIKEQRESFEEIKNVLNKPNQNNDEDNNKEI